MPPRRTKPAALRPASHHTSHSLPCLAAQVAALRATSSRGDGLPQAEEQQLDLARAELMAAQVQLADAQVGEGLGLGW